MPNKRKHNLQQVGWTRRFAPRLCCGRYVRKMNIESESKMVLEIAKSFSDFVSSSVNQWDEVYLRFKGDNESCGVTSTYLYSGSANYIDADDEMEFEIMSKINDLFQQLQDALSFKVALLCISSNLDFKIEYEQENTEKWEITKLNGGSGIPKDYDSEQWWQIT